VGAQECAIPLKHRSFTMKGFTIAAAAAVLLLGMLPGESRAEFQPEPFAGDMVNESAQRVLIVGDDVLAAGGGFQFACQSANSSTHNIPWATDVDFFFDPATVRWCKIGIWEGKRFGNGTWHCPEGWLTPAQAGLPGNLRC
jgi:hypothetical protein